MDMKPQLTYTAWGRVRGGCGHAHRSPEAAVACRDRDHVGCQRQCGPDAYSDRTVRVLGRPSSARDNCDQSRGPGRPWDEGEP
jgi:hypothetical protein